MEELLNDPRNEDFSTRLTRIFIAGLILNTACFMLTLWTPVIKKGKILTRNYLVEMCPSGRHCFSAFGLSSIANMIHSLTKLGMLIQFIIMLRARYSHVGKVCSGDYLSNPLVDETMD